MLSVRGIGVAVIVRTSTFLRICLMRSLCATPKRCSSSTTSRPRSLKVTSFDSRRCVPTMTSRRPEASASSVSLISCLVRKRLTMSIFAGKRGKAIAQRLEVLRGEHRGRRQERDLLAVHHRLERGAHRHFGLAVADVAAQQAVHRRRRFHVALDVGDRGGLVGREVELERVFEFLLPVRVGTKRVAGHRLARGVELEQLFRHVAHRLLDAGLGLLPGGAAQPIERRLRRRREFLDQVEAFDRHEQLGVAVIDAAREIPGRRRRWPTEICLRPTNWPMP